MIIAYRQSSQQPLILKAITNMLSQIIWCVTITLFLCQMTTLDRYYVDQCGTRLESLQTQLISKHTLELECCLLFNLKSTCMRVGTCQAGNCRWRQPQLHPQGWWSTTPWSSTSTPTSSFFCPMSPWSLWFPSCPPPPPPPSSLTNPFSLDHPFSGHHFRARASFLHFPPFLFTTNHRHHLSKRGDFSTKGSL